MRPIPLVRMGGKNRAGACGIGDQSTENRVQKRNGPMRVEHRAVSSFGVEMWKGCGSDYAQLEERLFERRWL